MGPIANFEKSYSKLLSPIVKKMGPIVNFFGPIVNFFGPIVNFEKSYSKHFGPIVNFMGPIANIRERLRPPWDWSNCNHQSYGPRLSLDTTYQDCWRGTGASHLTIILM